jgi:hypothetical protein
MATIDELAKKNALDAQAQSDRASVGGIVNTVKDANNRAGAAIADLASMPIRGAVGAYDSAVVRPMRAAGINAGYLSPLVTPNGADPASPTPFYDKIAAQDAAPKIIPTPGVSPTGGITGKTPPAVATLAASPIQAQAQQASAAPVAPATTPIQKLGIRRQPLNVPLQGAQSVPQPAQQGIAPNVDLPESPIAYVAYGGNNSTQVAYKDGKTAEIMQGQAMPEDVKAFNLISQQAGQQGGNVNVMRGMPETYNKDGTMRSAGGVQQTLALPAKPGEAFMREVPVELGGNIAAIGKYQAAQSQGAINNAAPTTAANEQRMAELGLTTGSNEKIAQGNNATSTRNAGISAGPGYAGVNQRASEAANELGFKREQSIKPIVVSGGQEPVFNEGMYAGMQKVPDRLYDPKNQKWLDQPTAAKAASASAAPPAAAITMLKSNPKYAADFDKKYGAGASAQILGK